MTTPRGIASSGINWLPVVTMHLKQEHFCQGFHTEHAIVNIHGFCAPIRCSDGNLSVTHFKLAGHVFAVDIIEANFVSH
jgi:hypothetical protein